MSFEDLDGIVAFDGSHLQFWHRLQQDFPDRPIGLPVFAVTLEYRGQIDVEDEFAEADASKLLGFCWIRASVARNQREKVKTYRRYCV